MTTQTRPLSSSRIRPDIRRMLAVHILEELPLREACRRAGLPYHKNVSKHKFSKAGRAYVAHLKRRRRVIVEFGADIPSLARLIEIRDQALEAGSHVAAVRAQELCLKAATKAKADGKEVGRRKDPDDMTREEILAEIKEIKLKANGKGFDAAEDLEVTALRKSLERTKKI